jgi:two-component SAPR family response regulator
LLTAFEINKSEFDKVMDYKNVDGFIQKPVSMERLNREVSRCLGGSIESG